MATQPNLFDGAPESRARPSGAGVAPPPDQPARDFAIDPRHHVVLEASAGTGKTRVLVDRYVRLIAAGVDPEHILAITFTRKAAAEMRERVIAELRRQAALGPPMRDRWREIEARLPDVNILTIDAFCFGLLREFPLEADVDPAFEIADETEMARYVNEAIALTFRASRALVARDEHVRLLLAKVKLPQLRSALDTLLNRRHVAMPALGAFVARHAGAASTEVICRTFIEHVGRILVDGPEARAILDDGPAGAVEFAWLLGDLRALSDLARADTAVIRRFRTRLEHYFLSAGRAPRKQAATRFKNAFPSPAAKKRHQAAIKTLAPQVAGLLDALDRDVNALLARGLHRLLAIAIERYESLLEDHAVLDFAGMLERAVRLLDRQEEFARSRLKLQSRYHHVLVDELQDTSRLQWRLVELLVRAWREGEGPEDTPPSIFVVGDRKQSIYRFRQAEVTLLDEAARFIGDLRPGAPVRHVITYSFRAVPELLAFVNALAEEIGSGSALPERFAYTERDRFPAASVSPRALRDGEPVLGLIAGSSIPECAEAVAAEVDRLLRTAMVRGADGLARGAKPEDIAILFRARAGHQSFERALTARGVRTYVYKGLGFFEAPEVQDLQALIRYLAEPESNLRAAEFLRSRFVRLSDTALVTLAPGLAQAIRSREFAVPAPGLDAVDSALLAETRASARRWLGEVDRVPPAELIDAVVAESAYVFEMRGRRLAQARENVKKVRALVRRIQNRGYTTMRRLADYFEKLRAGDESNAIIEAAGAVNLMTIHAAKGLEFPIVFVVNLQQAGRGGGPGISVIADGPGGEPDVVITGTSDGTRLEAAREDEELRRLLYVAVTRARDRLYLAAALKDGKFDKRRASLGALLPERLRALFVQQGLRAKTTPGVVFEKRPPGSFSFWDWVAQSGQVFAFHACAAPPGTGLTPERSLAEGEAPPLDVAPLLPIDLPRCAATALALGSDALMPPGSGPWVAASDRLAGTLVHRLFQRQVAATSRGEVARVARTLIDPDELSDIDEPADLEALLSEAAALFVAMRARPDVTAILESSTCQYEVPFSCRLPEAPGVIVRGTIDCLAIAPDGSIVILEFKTGQARPEHASQLALYRAAMEAAWPGRAIEARLVYPDARN